MEAEPEARGLRPESMLRGLAFWAVAVLRLAALDERASDSTAASGSHWDHSFHSYRNFFSLPEIPDVHQPGIQGTHQCLQHPGLFEHRTRFTAAL